MYANLVKIEKNIIKVNDVAFRGIMEDPEKQDELIKYFIKISKKIVNKYGSFSYVFSVKTLSLIDIQYYSFFRDFTLQMQDNFLSELNSITVEDTNEIIMCLFSYISVFFTKDNLSKLHFT
jgi:hypothetical protein